MTTQVSPSTEPAFSPRTTSHTNSEYVLTVDCPQRPGIVNAVAGYLVEQAGDIRELKQFDDPRHGWYFLRVHFSVPTSTEPEADSADPDAQLGGLRTAFTEIAGAYTMRFELRRATERRRVLIMVSKFDHCLNDLLFRA